MKYANSLKYINSFPRAGQIGDALPKRVGELCSRLGRVNLGTPAICLPDGGGGHSCAIMLESVIKASGHSVCRISAACGYDSRASILINGEIALIDDYNKAVFAIKSAVAKDPESGLLYEEVVFALGLLLCKMSGCEYVLLEGLTNKDVALDSICAPYDLIVMPSVYDVASGEEQIDYLCEAIRRGTREVISGNQKSEIYNRILNACALSGTRLGIPAKALFEVGEITSRSITFSYGGRSGYSLKSPSYVLRDSAMTVIECALALRRKGVKMPWSGISAGLAAANNMCAFDIISVSPRIIIDSAANVEECELLIKTGVDIFGDGSNGKISVL